MDKPFIHTCEAWLAKIELALQWKKERFQKYADECYGFFNGPATYMWDRHREMIRERAAQASTGVLGEEMMVPYFPITVNRLFEAVALYGPTLMHQYPQVSAEVVQKPMTDPNDPNEQLAQVFAQGAEFYGNWLQVEGEKKEEARLVITEAIVKGMGVTVTDMYTPPGSQLSYPKTEFLSCNDWVCDPDAKYMRGVQWAAIRRIEPVWLVEQKFGLTPGSLQGQYQSAASQTTPLARQQVGNGFPQGNSFDLIEYWDIYSKAGFGERLHTATPSPKKLDTTVFGDYCRIVVSRNIEYPLNIPPEWTADPESVLQNGQQIIEAVQWPIPFYLDSARGWPFEILGFYWDTDSPYPISIAKNGLGYLKFINWCMSFLADKAAAAGSTYVGVMADAAKEIKDQLLSNRSPFKIIEISNMTGKSVTDLISFLQAPAFSLDLWKMVDEVAAAFDKATGLTELLYGMTGRQLRTATEAEVKDKNVNIRPDDMLATTDAFMSRVVDKEIKAMGWRCQYEHLAPVVGEQMAYYMLTYLAQVGPDAIARDLRIRVVAESSRKPNKEGRRKALDALGQVSMATIQQFAMMGQTQPWNAFISEYAKTLDLDASQFLIQPFQPPQPEPGPDPMQQAEQEHQHKLEQMAMEQQHESEEGDKDREAQKEAASVKARASNRS